MGIDLALIWAVIILFGIMMYVIMDGFDLGIGILFPLVSDPGGATSWSTPWRPYGTATRPGWCWAALA